MTSTRTTNVIQLKPMRHWQFDVWETKHGFLAEGREAGRLLWEYETDDPKMITRIIERMLNQSDD